MDDERVALGQDLAELFDERGLARARRSAHGYQDGLGAGRRHCRQRHLGRWYDCILLYYRIFEVLKMVCQVGKWLISRSIVDIELTDMKDDRELWGLRDFTRLGINSNQRNKISAFVFSGMRGREQVISDQRSGVISSSSRCCIRQF
jgi:hypothetical protein